MNYSNYLFNGEIFFFSRVKYQIPSYFRKTLLDLGKVCDNLFFSSSFSTINFCIFTLSISKIGKQEEKKLRNV